MKNPRILKGQKAKSKSSKGFSLTELITAVTVIGTLSAISVPSYIRQAQRGCQRDAENSLNQIMPAAQAFTDEYGTPATGWNDIDKIGTIMTSSGPAKGENFSLIKLPTCDYGVSAVRNGNEYIFVSYELGNADDTCATNQNTGCNSGFNIVSCLNVSTGASQIKLGDGSTPASSGDVSCS